MKRSTLVVLTLACAVRAQDGSRSDGALAVQRAGCLACHGPAESHAVRPLRLEPRAFAATWLRSFLATHQKPGAAGADDLAAYLGARADAPARVTRVAAGEAERGARLWRESGCAACHAQDGIAGLADKTWIPAVERALRASPSELVPSHDFGFDATEARSLAAFLLRAQATDAVATVVPGLQVECFELEIRDAGLPDLDGMRPSRTGTANRIDVSPRSRDDDFALRFSGFLDVPTAGNWRFWTGSDDSSWLWIDEQLVVRNEGLAPYRRKEGRIELGAGVHAIRVMFTEAKGGERLDVHWRGPGVAEEEIPPRALAGSFVEFRGPDPSSESASARVEAGRAAYRQRRCAACHGGDASPAPRAPAWGELRAGADCAFAAIPPAVRSGLGRPLPQSDTPAARLAQSLRQDGCTACHVSQGSGGLDAATRASLVEREDLGEEGKVPPDLTDAGSRLREGWIRDVIAGRRRARPYLAVRMPHFDDATAERYAALFLASSAEVVTREPLVDGATVAQGRTLAGANVGGFACIACHRVAGRRSLGPQGMDLALQYERLRPEWMREWIRAPASHRPGTRMPSFFVDDSPDSRAKIDALVSWMALGPTLPLPAGLIAEAGQWRLAVADRPRLHGAFLKGLSARCIAVATPERVNWAYDLGHARLAWIWRGEFLDTSGTWDGRAGQLLEPIGTDVLLLEDGGEDFRLVGDGAARATVAGWRLDTDGHPVMKLRIGGATIEDAPRPRYAAGGAVLQRTISVTGGDVRLLRTDGDVLVRDGESKEVTYRW